jgi:O-antigen/teichoic acid export membrane protein
MRSGISWNFLGAVSTNGARLVVIAVLGRTLSSADFGVVAAAVSVNVILFAIRDIGVGTAIVQRKTIEPGHITTAFALSTYLGLAISALLFLAAPLIGELYGITASVDVLRVLGLLFALRGVSTTSRMMCQRAMNFRAIAIIEALAFALGSAVSIGFAMTGAGPWALVAGYLTEEALSTALYLGVSPPKLSLQIDRARLAELMSFGAGQTIGQIAGTIANSGDNFVVGHVLGARELGYYTRAYDLIKFPSTVFSSIVGSVLLPAFSRFQEERTRLASSFRRVTFLNALVLLPASAILMILAPEVIRVLMGPKWDATVLPFRVLTIAMLMRTNQRLGAIVATAAGAVNGVAVIYVLYLLCVIGGAAVTIRWGIAAVAISTAVTLFLVNAGCSYLAIRVSGLRSRELVAAHVPGLVLAGVVGAVAWPITSALRGTQLSSPLVLCAGALLAGAIGVIGVALCMRRGGTDFSWLRTELSRVRRVRRS